MRTTCLCKTETANARKSLFVVSAEMDFEKTLKNAMAVLQTKVAQTAKFSEAIFAQPQRGVLIIVLLNAEMGS
jgi:hypothetical protein